jgi:hypothetical protein
MNPEKICRPTISTIAESTAFNGVPEVTEIHYDLWILRITLKFEAVEHPIYVSFGGVCGFRVLDEGDLLEFWDPNSRAEGWLWHVKDGGWFALENIREGFVSGAFGGYNEYLVIGIDDCVSIFSTDEPKIEVPQP